MNQCFFYDVGCPISEINVFLRFRLSHLWNQSLFNDLDGWDQVVQCNISIPSGKILVAGPTEDVQFAKRLEVRPGNYGMRIFWGGLDTVDELGFEGDDRYKIMMWPKTEFEERVIKSWRELAYMSLEASDDYDS